MLTQANILTFLRHQKQFLYDQFHVVEIGIFGSFARQENTPESDIDFLVKFDAGNYDFFSIKRGLSDYLEKEFERKADIAFKKSLKPHYKEKILAQAIYA